MTTPPTTPPTRPPAAARALVAWPTPQTTPPGARAQRAQCPHCHRWTRTGYAAGAPVIGQHHLGCCPCPGSYSPVTDDDRVEHTDARALGHLHTGAMPAVPHPRREPTP